MSLVYRLTVPAEEVNLVHPRLEAVNLHLEFTSLGTPDTGFLPQCWAYGTNRDQVAEQLSTTPAVRTVTQQAVCPDRVRYAIDWDSHAEAVTHLERLNFLLDDVEATLLFGRITSAQWIFLCQFPTQEAVIRCYTECGFSECQLAQRTDLEFADEPLEQR
ncbi:hypothetical protein [Haladaptatus sp. CMAA 1911]|uniref:hypothetical protein n=1 Tax=unclassified Haladaptatus TaxID=2622732 RepID=UPI003754F135